jgi:hypothetical protein
VAKRKLDLDWQSKIKPASSKADDYISAIVFGGYGTGKTKFCGTWPNPFFLAAEDGMMTLKDTEIPFIGLDADKAIYSTVLDILAMASNKQGVFENVDTFVIDSMSKLNRLMIDEIKEESGGDKFEFDEWGKLRSRMNKLNNLFVRLPMHRLATVSEAFREDQESKDLKPTFNIEGGFRHDFAGEYDNVWWFSNRQVGRTVRYSMNTTINSGRAAKTRLSLPIEIENPTYDVVQKLSQEGK